MAKKEKWIMIMAAIAAVGFFPAMGSAQPTQPKGAVVIKDESIVFINVDNTLMEMTLTEMKGSTKVVTPSPNCNKNVSAHGKYPIQPLDRSVVFDFDNTEIPCIVNFDGIPYATNHWHQVISRSGRVSLTCHFKICEEAGPPEETPCPTDPICLSPWGCSYSCDYGAPGCSLDFYGSCCTGPWYYPEVEPGKGAGYVCPG